MTREERDKLQALIDEQPELEQISAKELSSYSTKRARRQSKMRRSFMRAQRFGLVQHIAPLIPDVVVGDGKGGGLNLTALLGPVMKILAPKWPAASKGAIFPVVEGHDEHDSEHMSDEDLEIWQDNYCLKVPGDLLNEALMTKTNRWMSELAFKHDAKESTPNTP